LSDQVQVCMFKCFHAGQFPDAISPCSDKKTQLDSPKPISFPKHKELDRGPERLRPCFLSF